MTTEQWLGLAFLSVAVAGAVYTYYDLKRIRLIDYAETIERLTQHVLSKGADLIDALERVLRPPRPTWSLARRMWAWLHLQRLFVAIVLLYDDNNVVADVRLHWQRASNATAMFNEVSTGYGTLIDPLDEEHDSWLSTDDPANGCMVWVEAVYPKRNFFWRKNA